VAVLLLTAAAGCALASVASASDARGAFPLRLVNGAHGRWSDRQIYVTVLGIGSSGRWSYLRPDGTMAALDYTMASAPGHLEKDGHPYPNMSFTLARARTVMLPATIVGARIYISVGSPMFLAVNADNSGWAGPDLLDPSDPNHDVYFDWYELTYQYRVIPFGGNTTQVDMFGLPLVVRLRQRSSGYDRVTGIRLTRQEVYARYRADVGPAFRSLAGRYRILAPHIAPRFDPAGVDGGYLNSEIDAAWSKWANDGFAVNHLGESFTGRVIGDVLSGAMDGTQAFSLAKPTSSDVLGCSGALASPGMSPADLALGAVVCAALSRGVATRPSALWYRPSAYYTALPDNEYAGFFHTIAIGHRAYGFPYDDVNDQSSVAILPDANPPSSLTITVGW
jgi:Beta-1,3-glucanase